MSSTPFTLGEFAGPRRFTGLVMGPDVFDLQRLDRQAPAGRRLTAFRTLQDLLADWDRNFERLVDLADRATSAAERFAFTDLTPRPPIAQPLRMLYAAANYRDHVKGMRRTFTSALPPAAEPPTSAHARPYLFAKACEVSGARDDIVLPRGMQRIDWEAELAVVIGRPGRRIANTKVAEHIAGYVATNDVSCRDLTWREDRPAIRSDWLAGKSFDSFAPFGPVFAPKAFVPDHADLGIRLWVNGVLKQDGNSKDMIFNIEDQVSFASSMVTLRPGDIIATGTPAGTGQERLEFLKAGDIVELEIDHCGRLRNRVVDEPGDAL